MDEHCIYLPDRLHWVLAHNEEGSKEKEKDTLYV